MKLLDILLASDMVLIGDYYYDVSHDDIVDASEEEQRDFRLSDMCDGEIWLKVDLHQEVEATGRDTYPQIVIKTSVGTHYAIPYTLQQVLPKYLMSDANG